MATKQKPEQEVLREQIRDLVLARLRDPLAFIKWSEGLVGAERIGRIAKSKESTLTYCLTRFVLTDLTQVISMEYRLYVVIDDIMTKVTWRHPDGDARSGEFGVAHPDWLFDFFEDEDRAGLLDAACTEKLGEVLQQVYEVCIDLEYIVLQDV